MAQILTFLQSGLGITIVSAIGALIGSILGVLLTHFLYGRKLKKERNARQRGLLADTILKSYEVTRELELKTKTTEIFEIENLPQEQIGNIGFFEPNNAFVCEIVYTFEALNDFLSEINELRKNTKKI